MASNYTEHYQLPLWEPEDSFLREEFNEANRKVDGALALATTQVTLSECIVDSELSQLDLDLSTLELEQFHGLIIRGNIMSSQAVRMKINEIGTEGYRVATAANATNTAAADYCQITNGGLCTIKLELLPAFNNLGFLNFSISTSSVLFSRGAILNCTLEELRVLHLDTFNSGTINAGTKLTVWGLR